MVNRAGGRSCCAARLFVKIDLERRIVKLYIAAYGNFLTRLNSIQQYCWSFKKGFYYLGLSFSYLHYPDLRFFPPQVHFKPRRKMRFIKKVETVIQKAIRKAERVPGFFVLGAI